MQIAIDERGVQRSTRTRDTGARATTELVRFEERFGVLLLLPPRALTGTRPSRAARAEVGQLVFTAAEQTRTVLVELDAHLRQHPAQLRRHDAGAPTGGQVLAASDARRLLEAIERRAPHAFERLYLSTSAGPLLVEGGALHLPDVSFDLGRALAHDSYVFLEGPVLYRALAVRQAPPGSALLQERVFVVPLAEPVGADHDRSRAASVPHRAAPRRELRVALEQAFFAPLAALLAEAPRTADALGLVTSDAATPALLAPAESRRGAES